MAYHQGFGKDHQLFGIRQESYLNELDDSDFYANVDLANIIVDKDDTNKASVKVDIGCTKYRHSITFNGGDHMLPLSVEKYMQKQFELKVSLDGSLSGSKALGNKPQANPKVVRSEVLSPLFQL